MSSVSELLPFTDLLEKIIFSHRISDTVSFQKQLESLASLFTSDHMIQRCDASLNHILFDADTRKALCIIDLDTVMPGLSLYDFGDSIRFGANTGTEDETDLTKVGLDLSLFEAFTKGYLEGCAGSLTAKEIELLPMGAKLMTYECGIRFLADFLTGDHYFKIHREHHNLDRARTQFRLVADMEAKWDKMTAIVKKFKNP